MKWTSFTDSKLPEDGTYCLVHLDDYSYSVAWFHEGLFFIGNTSVNEKVVAWVQIKGPY